VPAADGCDFRIDLALQGVLDLIDSAGPMRIELNVPVVESPS